MTPSHEREGETGLTQRELVEKGVHRGAIEAGFHRVSRRNLWVRPQDQVLHALGFYGSWHGGARNYEWGVWVPGLGEIMADRAEAEPTRVDECNLRGTLSHLLAGANDYTITMKRLNSGSLPSPSKSPAVDESTLSAVVETTDRFVAHLSRFSTPDDVLAYIRADADARNRFWPTRGLTMLFSAALAVLTHNDEAVAMASQAREHLQKNKTWSASANRVFQLAVG